MQLKNNKIYGKFMTDVLVMNAQKWKNQTFGNNNDLYERSNNVTILACYFKLL